MKIINTICITSAIALLSSCSGGGTKHPSQLVKKAKANEIHCYDMDISTIEKRINQFLDKCFVDHTFSSDSRKTTGLPRGVRLSLTNGNTYQFSAELRSNTSGCTTEVRMYGIDSDWREVLDETNKAVHEKAYICP